MGANYSGSKLVILVAEDNPDMRAFYKIYQEGHPDVRFLFSANGRSFLRRAKAQYDGIDALISDGNMPILPGIDAMESIRVYEARSRPGQHKPAAMLTSGGYSRDIAKRAKKAGVVKYIEKRDGNPIQDIDEAVRAVTAELPQAAIIRSSG